MFSYQVVIDYWFDELGPSGWYKKSDATDIKIRDTFSDLLIAITKGEYASWRVTALGALAEVIVLDQFSRNIYRDTPHAFSQDPQALTLAQLAIEKGFDQLLPVEQRVFFYMPFMHSESSFIHQQAMVLFKGLSNEDYELAHKNIIDQFGRYPHRNAILGRQSSAEEVAFLAQPGSHF
ncbi:MAG: hypothetical protein ACJAVX_002872 [Pseudoalteromonas rhizosphaerae]|jgi:uncharacterized protein (DUF924 family)|uniref:DUF924 domain-containing protein n=1 Tax=Pseudoalteromonas neustonica TaxID=1840331 RepID=A0ABY3FIX0_9GAMM|nr:MULTISPECIES: DUF924 family protein [Pseudoalteromonas]MBB1291773.1 DUF924 domain-containing protein [Pseudoalteromonas sp. SR41-4]MBB1299800.1 DUF924 domain-containing protein [Pseudoalteromonas sp. SR44-8]MBB1415943.1 DUF924 domain-containing protein [Pseudoalteromonas sp. SG44-1]MBB1433014.1 DUF924 domain-containing protein [Pseudoalteromonas sp. SG43-6]TVU86503.1 DUF924 domain-containing protein [Pseudoalteromonas neustonica]